MCGYKDWKICSCVKEYKLASTEVEDQRYVGSWLKDLPVLGSISWLPLKLRIEGLWAVD